MGVVSGLVLFAVIWAMCFLIALPIRVKTQGDLHDIVPGTHAGAPEHHYLGRKALWVTLAAAVLWAIVAAIILSGRITVDDVETWFRAGAWSGRDIRGQARQNILLKLRDRGQWLGQKAIRAYRHRFRFKMGVGRHRKNYFDPWLKRREFRDQVQPVPVRQAEVHDQDRGTVNLQMPPGGSQAIGPPDSRTGTQA